MILSIGEILADMIGENVNGNMNFKAFCGGAPFNVAVGAKNADAKVKFVGRVGNDPVGKFITNEAQKFGLHTLDVQVDNVRNTTIAFVTLTNGERDFAFYRHDTADFNIDLASVDFCDKELNIVHLGSLMLSEDNGRKLALSALEKTKNAGKILSFDINFRMDIYKDFNDAKMAYKPFVDSADIIKFSDDELKLYTNQDDIYKGIKTLNRKDALILLTMGSKGSAYFYGDLSGVVPTKKVKPIDTTGAGDAFFGTFLAHIENKEWNKENVESALVHANKAGAMATQFLGAIKL